MSNKGELHLRLILPVQSGLHMMEQTVNVFGRKRKFVKSKCSRLTTEAWSPPRVDFGSGALAGVGVGLELVTQHMLLALELAHVIHTALEERSGIHHTDTLPGTEANTQRVRHRVQH